MTPYIFTQIFFNLIFILTTSPIFDYIWWTTMFFLVLKVMNFENVILTKIFIFMW
jgi:hypothetical protein